MALDWTCLKETRKINRDSSTRLESTGSMKKWKTKEDTEKICRRGNKRKMKDLERGEEVSKGQNVMGKVHISSVLRKA
jgi:hypothetical protein